MSGSCFTTTSPIWNLGLQLDLVNFTVLLAQRDLSLCQDQNGTEKNQETKTTRHSFSMNLISVLATLRDPWLCLTPSLPYRKLEKGWE